MENYKFIAVDIQNEFATQGGKFYSPKPSVQFLKDTLFPFLKQKRLKISEIVSDYRQPRLGDRGDGCHPGEWSYESVVPVELRSSQWIKCMNSPVWIRKGIGDQNQEPGLPYSDPRKFGQWLDENIGSPEQVAPVVFGLTIDCCVLSTVQELSWRGYYPLVLKEGVDHASGKIEDRDKLLESPIPNWAEVISWEELKSNLA